MTTEIGHPAALDLTRYIRPGALVAWGQGCAEPVTLTEALAADPAAEAFFAGLSGFYRRQYAEWIAGAKQQATRERRIAQVVDLLRQGRKSR